MTVVPAENPSISQLWSLCLEFQVHRQPPHVVTKFLLWNFPNTNTKVLDLLLSSIEDDERRTTLLLSFLASRPLCLTRYCGQKFSINCKRGSHHSVCDSGTDVDLAANMIQCRGCRATLVKVAGCSSVTCLCGFNMDWDEEFTEFQFMAKQMVSEDVFFNAELFAAWLEWKSQAPFAITSTYSAYRSKQLTIYLAHVSHILGTWMRRVVLHWRFRRNMKRLPAAWLDRKIKYYTKKLIAGHQAQTSELALLAADPSECLSISIGLMTTSRKSRISEQRGRAQRARKSRRDRRQKAHRAKKNLLFYVKTSAPKEISGDAKWTPTDHSMSYMPTLVPATRMLVPKRRAEAAAWWW